jgi:scavenger receptor class B, member 1
VPLYLDVYFFNWTNSEDFPDDPKTPNLQEIGPYRFREVRDKKNITFNDHNSTVSYRSMSTFFFDEEGSNGTLDDVITQLNIVAVGASAQAMRLDYEKRKYISMGLNSYEQKLVISKTVRELLFDGYEDNMVLMGREGLVHGFDVKDNPYDKIGWFYLVRSRFEVN